MPLPVTFATLNQGNQPLSLLDTQFSAIGALVTIPCSAAGQNIITLTPAANSPAIAAYTNLTPVFTWVQPQVTTGSVTIGLAGLNQLNAYGSNGGVALGAGDLAAGNVYQCIYNSSLNSGSGGFVVNSFSAITTVGSWVPLIVGDSAAGSATYSFQVGTFEQNGRQITARFSITATALTGIMGNVRIAGLPLMNNSIVAGVCLFSRFSGWNAAGYTFLGGDVIQSQTFANIIKSGPGQANTQTSVSEFATPTTFVGICSYYV